MSDFQTASSTGWTAAHTAAFNRVKAINPDYLILGGDIADDGVTYSPIKTNILDAGWGSKVIPMAGNHDYYSGSLNNWWAIFGKTHGTMMDSNLCLTSGATASAPWHSYNIDGWHVVNLFICLGSGTGEPDFGVGSAQYNWASADLAANSGTGKPTMVLWHQAKYSLDLGHGDAGSAQTAIWDLCRSYGVDIILDGHVHVNQRFPPANGSGVPVSGGPREFTSTGIQVRNYSQTQSVLTPDYIAPYDTTNAGKYILVITTTATTWKSEFHRVSDGTVVDPFGPNTSYNAPITQPDKHVRLGTVPDTGDNANANIIEISGSVDSRLSPWTMWVHSDSGGMSGGKKAIWALDYGGYTGDYSFNGVPTTHPSSTLYPMTFKKKILIDISPIPNTYGLYMTDQWEDMCYDERVIGGTPKNMMYVANCGDNSDNRGSYWVYGFPEPTAAEISNPSTVGTKTITKWFRFKWPNGVSCNCESMIIGPTGSKYPGTICFIPKSGAVPFGLYRMPVTVDNIVNNTLYELIKVVDWTSHKITNATRADWSPDGKEIIVSNSGPATPITVGGQTFQTHTANVFDGTSNFAYLRPQTIALAWGREKYADPSVLVSQKSVYGNENIHYTKDGKAIISSCDRGDPNHQCDVRMTILGGTQETPVDPPPPTPGWKWGVSSTDPGQSGAPPMPVGDLGADNLSTNGWNQVLAQDFNTDCTAGNFLTTYSGWVAYPDDPAWTNNHTTYYYGGKSIEVVGSKARLRFFYESSTGKFRTETLRPPVNQGNIQTHGVYSICYRLTNPLPGYKQAFLLWPGSNLGVDGEIDFPEASFDSISTIKGFVHEVEPPGLHGNNAYSIDTLSKPADGNWHTTMVKWGVNKVEFYHGVNGAALTKVGEYTSTTNIPEQQMTWRIQTEGNLSGTFANPGIDPATDGYLEIAWATAYTMATTPTSVPNVGDLGTPNSTGTFNWIPLYLWMDPSNKPISTYTNKVPNPSFEDDLLYWTIAVGNLSTLTRTTTGTAKYGSAYAYETVAAGVSATNVIVYTDYMNVLPGKPYCASGWAKWRTGATPRDMRLDILWYDSTDTLISPTNGTAVATNTSTWVQMGGSGIINAIAPTNAAAARLRVVILSANAAEAVNLDGFQFEQATSLPAYNP